MISWNARCRGSWANILRAAISSFWVNSSDVLRGDRVDELLAERLASANRTSLAPYDLRPANLSASAPPTTRLLDQPLHILLRHMPKTRARAAHRWRASNLRVSRYTRSISRNSSLLLRPSCSAMRSKSCAASGGTETASTFPLQRTLHDRRPPTQTSRPSVATAGMDTMPVGNEDVLMRLTAGKAVKPSSLRRFRAKARTGRPICISDGYGHTCDARTTPQGPRGALLGTWPPALLRTLDEGLQVTTDQLA